MTKNADVLDTGAEEMAQLVKSLLHSRRTQEQIPSSCLGKGPLSVAVRSSVLRRWRQVDLWSLLTTESKSSRFSERPCLYK